MSRKTKTPTKYLSTINNIILNFDNTSSNKPIDLMTSKICIMNDLNERKKLHLRTYVSHGTKNSNHDIENA